MGEFVAGVGGLILEVWDRGVASIGVEEGAVVVVFGAKKLYRCSSCAAFAICCS